MRTHICLFSGIGGFGLAARRTGFTTVQFCEIEPFPQAVLRKNFPGVPIHADVQNFDARSFRGTIDLLTMGFPCQDVSCAGNQEGITGKRSGLFFEGLRVITECRPRFCLLENVPNLRTKGADAVLEGLEEAGYTAGAFVVGAGDCGASHRRKRAWIVAYRNGERLEERQSIPGDNGSQCQAAERSGLALAHSESEQDGRVCVRGIHPEPEHAGDAMAYATSESANGYARGAQEAHAVPGNSRTDFPPGPAGDWSGINRDLWPVESALCAVDDGIPRQLVRRRGDASKRAAILKGLGNAIVPQVAELFMRWIAEQIEAR